ncbi:hypothetical protein PR048_000929 [Dryococelus australis]|uniref:Uncharacterized protein n=1 Tax=Dryococelus australis TaxID=614101 RepID=A0ABQ9IFY7_9NEOP|nr:hypothetical protein PR048_000929 [Dryococelus australis]
MKQRIRETRYPELKSAFCEQLAGNDNARHWEIRSYPVFGSVRFKEWKRDILSTLRLKIVRTQHALHWKRNPLNFVALGSYLNSRGHGRLVVRLLASHEVEQGSITGLVAPKFSQRYPVTPSKRCCSSAVQRTEPAKPYQRLSQRTKVSRPESTPQFASRGCAELCLCECVRAGGRGWPAWKEGNVSAARQQVAPLCCGSPRGTGRSHYHLGQEFITNDRAVEIRPFVLREYVYVDALGRLDVYFTFQAPLHSIIWGFMGITGFLLRCSFQPASVCAIPAVLTQEFSRHKMPIRIGTLRQQASAESLLYFISCTKSYQGHNLKGENWGTLAAGKCVGVSKGGVRQGGGHLPSPGNCISSTKLVVGFPYSLPFAHSGPPKTAFFRARSPAGSLPDFRMWESCWAMPLAGGLSRGIPVSPALAFQHCSILGSHFMSCSGMTDTYGSQLESPSLGECCLALGPPPYAFIS